MKLKHLKEDYVPIGQLEGFPLEVIDKMLEKQVEQGDYICINTFETQKGSRFDEGGFDWEDTEEGYDFWRNVIICENFDLFFQKYPDEKPLEFPRVIEVRNSDDYAWVRRVCIMIKNNRAICWNNAETLEEAEEIISTCTWKEWREIEEEPKEEYKPFDFSEGVDKHLDLLGKKIVSKDNKALLVINELGYHEIEGDSSINQRTTIFLFENYTFEDGSPVGVKIK